MWSLSYFTFTLKQLLKPDTREYVYKNMGFTQILILMQVSRLWNLPLSNHCTPDCKKLFRVSNETLYPFSTIREGTCTWPGWLAMVPPWEPCFWRMAPWLTMVNQGTFDHGHHGWPWSTMILNFWQLFQSTVDHALAKLCQSVVGDALAKLSLTMVNHGLWNGTSVSHGWPCSDQACINHGQPWLWNGTSVNHGCPCSGQAFHQPWLTMLWPRFHRPWLTMLWPIFHQPWFVKWHLSHPWLTVLWLSFNHAFIPRLNWGAISQTMVQPWLKAWFNHGWTMFQPWLNHAFFVWVPLTAKNTKKWGKEGENQEKLGKRGKIGKVLSLCPALGNYKSWKSFRILRQVEIVVPKTIANLGIMKLGKSQNFYLCLNFWPKFWFLTALHLETIKCANFQNFEPSWNFGAKFHSYDHSLHGNHEVRQKSKFQVQNPQLWPFITWESWS